MRKVDGATHFLPLTDPDDYVWIWGLGENIIESPKSRARCKADASTCASL